MRALSGTRSPGYIALRPGSTAPLNSARMPQQLRRQLRDIRRDQPAPRHGSARIIGLSVRRYYANGSYGYPA
jgi:hypothetical protein